MSISERMEELRNVMQTLPADVREKSILAGGAVRAVFDGTATKDYDLFFRSASDARYVDDWFATNAAYSLEHSYPTASAYMLNGKLFNLVMFGFGEPVDIIAGFDFRACQLAVEFPATSPRGTLVPWPHAATDALMRRLVVVNNNGDERTLKRIKHYVEDYGYTLDQPRADSVDIDLKLDIVRAALAAMPRSGRGSTGGGGY